MQIEYAPQASRRAEWLALGFGATAAMWGTGYLLRLPYINAPGWLILIIMLCIMSASAVLAGRFGSRGAFSGLRAGLVSALLNLLILGSLLGSETHSSALMALAALLFTGFSGLVGLAGGAVGQSTPRGPARLADWTPVFAWVTAGTALLLIIAGGMVTSSASGLAVVDWPNSQGVFMFLYPLSRMTGGIYFEHAHRLLGSLTGLAVLAFALHLTLGDPRRWVKGLAWATFALVAIQGVLGGLRVTGHLTLGTSGTHPNLLLAVIHGVLAQIIYALLVALAIATTRGWRQRRSAPAPAGIVIDITLATWLMPVVLAQICIGAVLRHFKWGLHLHIAVAVIVLFYGISAGVRAWGIYQREVLLSRAGLGLVYHLGAQLALGLAAWAAVGAASGATPVYMVVIATLHQTTGALVLSAAGRLMLWTRRLASLV
jgi:cytochrome c oxidase assembly protein subunit 15